MNNGAFGENFPYSNFHDLNMDWIIKIAKDFLDQYTHIQDVISQGLEDLQTKYENLETLLNEWYEEHSEDIANQLADALEDLNEWYTTHQDYLDQTLADNTALFNARAEAKTAECLESIPADYDTLYGAVDNFEGIIVGTWEQGNINDSTGVDSENNYRIRTSAIEITDNLFINVKSGYKCVAYFYDLSSGTEYIGYRGWLRGFNYIYKEDATHVRFMLAHEVDASLDPSGNVNMQIGRNITWNDNNTTVKGYFSFSHIADTDTARLTPDSTLCEWQIHKIKPNHIYDIFVTGGNRRVFGLSNNPSPVIGEVMECAEYYLSDASGDKVFRFTNGDYNYLYAYCKRGSEATNPFIMYIHDLTEANFNIPQIYKGWGFVSATGLIYRSTDMEMVVTPVEKNTDYKISITGGNRRRIAFSNDPYPIENNYTTLPIEKGASTSDTVVYVNSGNYNYCYVYYYTNEASQDKQGNVVIIPASSVNTISESFSRNPCLTQGANTGDKLSVMTYNIYTFQKVTGSSAGLPSDKMLNLRKFLGETDTDVICLQECPEFIDTSETELTNDYIFLPQYPFSNHRNSWGDSDNVIESKIEMTNTGSVKLSQYGGGARSIRYGVITIGQKKVLIVSTHASWRDGGGEATSAEEIAIRQSNYEDIFNWVDGDIQLYNMTETMLMSVPEHTHCIVCLDSNTITSTDKTNLKYVADTHEFIMGNGGRFGWFYTCDIDLSAPSSLDNIIVSNNIIINNIESMSGAYNSLYSDHAPVIAKLTLL